MTNGRVRPDFPQGGPSRSRPAHPAQGAPNTPRRPIRVCDNSGARCLCGEFRRRFSGTWRDGEGANGLPSHIEQMLVLDDARLRGALARAKTLYHHGEGGAAFEQDVRDTLNRYLPSYYRIGQTLLEGQNHEQKQLDIVVHPASIPTLPLQLPIDVLTAVGEVKTTLTSDGILDATATAQKLASAAARTTGLGPVPFFVIAGALGVVRGHDTWLSRHLAGLASVTLAAPVWPAIFSFDERGGASSLRITDTTPIRATTDDGEPLDGILTLTSNQLSSSAVCYLWLWAAIHASDAAGMDYRYMRRTFAQLVDKEGGLQALFRPHGSDEDHSLSGVRLSLTDLQLLTPRHDFRRPLDPAIDISDRVALPAPDDARPTSADALSPSPGAPAAPRYMLITLRAWVEEPDSWDESPWGGHPHATRRGYGYYDDMTDQELLDAARLFWAFNPDSGNWDDLQYALVAHGGTVRAVIEIQDYIGPFWGRHGFQGRLVTDQAVLANLLDRPVPSRQNPITTISFE